MKIIDAYACILKLGQPVFRTDDAALYLNLKNAHASKILSRLKESGHVFHINRGLWAVKEKIALWDLTKYLTIPFPNYISLQSALYHHGIISQIPSVIYIVSPARSRTIRTALGTVSVHHVHSSFFRGCVRTSDEGPMIATKEKALIDFMYLHPSKSGFFRALPEVEIHRNFSVHRARKFIGCIKSKRRRSMVNRLFEEFMSKIQDKGQ